MNGRGILVDYDFEEGERLVKGSITLSPPIFDIVNSSYGLKAEFNYTGRQLSPSKRYRQKSARF